MKIGILTLPLHSNYGGNLQAYALLKVLKRMGHDAWLIDRGNNRNPWWRVPLVVAKRFSQRYLLGKRGIALLPEWEREIIGVHSRRFIEKNIQPQTEKFRSTKELQRGIGRYNFNAIVVGSDQVWRPDYAPDIEEYFLGFLEVNDRVKRVSYAASFGTESWDFDKARTDSCRSLLRRFNAVSVRERSGVEICRDKFGVDAIHVLDPTMLLDQGDYLDLLPEGRSTPPASKGVLVYILDMNPGKHALVTSVCTHLGLPSFSVNGRKEDKTARLSERVAPPVEDWLRGFRDAKFIVTDSFHACVFSILFRRPFIAIGNASRGLSRFQSLLGMFGLEERLILNPAQVDSSVYLRPIEWDAVAKLLEAGRQRSNEFLQSATLAD